MYPGCLLVFNYVDPAQEAEFNSWYQAEHLSERLSVPGFMTARRYRETSDQPWYVALYETRTPDVLVSPTYAAMLRSPTPRTQAIMPSFRKMTRVIGRLAFKHEAGMGGVMALVFISVPKATDDQAARIAQIALRAQGLGQEPEAVRVLVSQEDPVGTRTPESSLRPGPDRSAQVILIVEWLQAKASDVARMRKALREDGWDLESDRGGVFCLLCARRNAEAL